MEKKFTYIQGVKDGLPIGIAYLAVSFTVGIYAVQNNLSAWMALCISLSNFTSTGEVAGIGLIAISAPLFEIATTVLIINLRYAVMSLSLSQQFESSLPTWKRIIYSFFITDEVFALCALNGKKVTGKYFLGTATLPYILWSLGTFLGALVNNILPERIQVALGIAIYCMFIALVIPPARSNKAILFCVAISTALSCLFYYCPGLNKISTGFRVIIVGIVASIICAFIFPIKDEDEKEDTKQEEVNERNDL
jgi:predicted branched-subunit amino acid permease